MKSTNYELKRIMNKIVDEAKVSSPASFLLRKNSLIKDLIKSRLKNRADLASFKREAAKKYKIPCPSNIELLKLYHKLVGNKSVKREGRIENLLKTRPIRSLSGIVNVSVLTKPYSCPGKCLYCPKEKGIPKSYVSGEPAVERAKKLNFDPYLQVKKRLEMLISEGHPTDKIELRIAGGTWSYYPKKYQNWFILRCFQAANQNSTNYTMVGEEDKSSSSATELSPRESESGKEARLFDFVAARVKNVLLEELRKEQKRNEKTKHRMVGLSIETRPDFINEKEIKWLRELGVTMVELGVQSIYDDVLKMNLRGHGVKEIILATKFLKDAGFKVLYQMMPNLPSSNLKRDEKMFEELFENPDFQPDLLKIYPCAILKEAPLYRRWKKGQYKPYTKKQLINLLKSIKNKIPCYVRIQRISRDIPSQKILAGPAKISNLRQILLGAMGNENWQCHCIRCREVKEKYDPKEKLYLFRQDYEASDGEEIFLSFENKNRAKLYSLLRLRITSGNKAIIREIHTYGQLHSFKKTYRGRASVISPQHKGLGKKLIRAAEKIAKKEFDLSKIAVISAVGAKNYFRQLGYRLKNTYMIKNL